jgi:hypothetical protein
LKVKNGRIVEATESELRNYWLTKGLDDIYSFPEYLEKMQECGVKIVEEAENEAD